MRADHPMVAPLTGLYEHSCLLTLDFGQIDPNTPESQNIQSFFESCQKSGIDPKTPEQRQRFNNHMLQETGARYLVSRYGEDRAAMLAGSSIAAEGRTLHLGIDIFCRDLETVYAPCDGEIVQTGREPQGHSFGHYVIIKPSTGDYFIFFGHMSAEQPPLGPIKAGQAIGHLGDFANGENGDWSRHLHIQLFRDLPTSTKDLIGYSTAANFSENSQRYPDPGQILPGLELQR